MCVALRGVWGFPQTLALARSPSFVAGLGVVGLGLGGVGRRSIRPAPIRDRYVRMRHIEFERRETSRPGAPSTGFRYYKTACRVHHKSAHIIHVKVPPTTRLAILYSFSILLAGGVAQHTNAEGTGASGPRSFINTHTYNNYSICTGYRARHSHRTFVYGFNPFPAPEICMAAPLAVATARRP